MIAPVILLKSKGVVFKTFYVQTHCSIVGDKHHRASIPVRALELSNRLLTMRQNLNSPPKHDKDWQMGWKMDEELQVDFAILSFLKVFV